MKGEHMNGHNLLKKIWNMMTYILWIHSFVYAAETAFNKKKKKKKKCLTMHVQMVCSYDIPHDLQNIMPLVRRVISPWIPFITIVIIRWYGGHYKLNGPPVNFPATPDQITEILLHIPSDLQLHPIKLKCTLEYKSHYMYDMNRRDRIISAITWLKEHNSHYANIQLNEHWYNDIAAK